MFQYINILVLFLSRLSFVGKGCNEAAGMVVSIPSPVKQSGKFPGREAPGSL